MKVMLYFLLVTIAIAESSSIVPKDLNKFLFGGSFEFHDLTHPFDANTIYWPGNRRFEFTKLHGNFKEDGSWYASNEFCAGEHGGTHIDAPFHYNINGSFVGDLPLKNLITPLIIVDMEKRVNGNPNFTLCKHHLDHMINNNFAINTWNCTVIFKFGWSKYYNNPRKYLGLQGGLKNGTMNFPGLSAEVAEWIVQSYRNIVGVGVDTPSVDPGSSTTYKVHKILHRAGIHHLENVKLTENIPESSCTALVLPMNIARGTGAPLRIVAICPKH